MEEHLSVQKLLVCGDREVRACGGSWGEYGSIGWACTYVQGLWVCGGGVPVRACEYVGGCGYVGEHGSVEKV